MGRAATRETAIPSRRRPQSRFYIQLTRYSGRGGIGGSRQSRVCVECGSLLPAPGASASGRAQSGSKLPHSIGASYQRRCAILRFWDLDVTVGGIV